MSHTFSGQIRWEETPGSATKDSTANTTRREGTLLKIVGRCGVT